MKMALDNYLIELAATILGGGGGFQPAPEALTWQKRGVAEWEGGNEAWGWAGGLGKLSTLQSEAEAGHGRPARSRWNERAVGGVRAKFQRAAERNFIPGDH